MLNAYETTGETLARLDLDPKSPVLPNTALWIDLLAPDPEQVAAVEALGVSVPSLDEMQEIEVSNRLYRDKGADYMTVVLPGTSTAGLAVASPVTFILTATRIVTVRHHSPRPFDTYPSRAGQNAAGCATPEQVFLGLAEEVIGRLADLLEEAGNALDAAGRRIFSAGEAKRPDLLQQTLEEAGRQGELLGRTRLAMMTLERALSYIGTREYAPDLLPVLDSRMADLQALAVHADFLSGRVSLISDATLGMISLAQNATVSIVSVVTALFLPPTLVASAYGMNFDRMPWLHSSWGYAATLALMLGSALGTYLFFKWKGWL